MRHEKFGRLTTIRKDIKNGSKLLDIKNLENLQYMNLEIVKVKPDFGSWVSHLCYHTELIRDASAVEAQKIKVKKVGRLADCTLWLGVCPVCSKYVIGVQKAEPYVSKKSAGMLLHRDLSHYEAVRKKADYEASGRRVRCVRATDGSYKLYLIE